MQTIHRTCEQSKAFNRDIVIYRAGGEKLKGINKISEWIASIPSGETIRSTYANVCDDLLASIAARGATIRYANWHDTGIEKNSEPQVIVDLYARLSDSLFRTLSVRRDVAELRHLLNMRHAIVEERKKAVQRVRATCRAMGMSEDCDYGESEKEAMAMAERIDVEVEGTKGTKVVSWLGHIEKKIAKCAKAIPECVLFNSVAHIGDAYITAASVVALSGGIERFDTVAALWHYCGEHVVEGKAPKRAKGRPSDWNARLRTVLWQLSDSIIKNRDNPWRTFYDSQREVELATHKEKCGCEYPEGHSGARARRKMRKEILKRFFLACQSVPFEENHRGHASLENHVTNAAHTASA